MLVYQRVTSYNWYDSGHNCGFYQHPIGNCRSEEIQQSLQQSSQQPGQRPLRLTMPRLHGKGTPRGHWVSVELSDYA